MRSVNRLAVSVVVPCRNEVRHVRRLIETLLQQDTTGLDVEVLIADGMSNDGTREVLEAAEAEHSHIRLLDNPGQIVSTGLNVAIRAARGEIVVRMDAHTEYARDYVRNCVEVLEQTGADNIGGAPRVKADSLRLRVIAAAYHSAFAVGGARSHDPDYEGYVDSVFYGCWRKTTLERLGLFDETLVRNQDDELNLRLTRAGGKIWQSRRIVCWYQPRMSLSSLSRQYLQYGFWKVAVIRKHRMPASWRHLAPGTFVLAIAGLPICAAIAQLSHAQELASSLFRTWVGVGVIYTAASLIAALIAVKRSSWKVAVALPVVFATYHISYGAGFCWGLLFWTMKGARRTPTGALTELTR